jgi:ribonuclease T2
MNTFWLNDPNDGTNEEFWEHEWATHGTCISTLKPSCYTNYVAKQEAVDFFTRAVALFKTVPSFQVSLEYTLLKLQFVLTL